VFNTNLLADVLRLSQLSSASPFVVFTSDFFSAFGISAFEIRILR